MIDRKEKLVIGTALQLAVTHGETVVQRMKLDPVHFLYLCDLVARDLEHEVKVETSTSISLWAEETFGPATALSTAIRAQVELTELVSKLQRWAEGHPVGMGPQWLFMTPEDKAEVMAEVADIRIVLARIQTFFPGAPTAEEAEDAKMAVNRARKWRLDGRGHGQHVDEEPAVHRQPHLGCDP